MSKIINKKTGIAAAIIAVVTTAAIVISTTVSNGMSLDEAKGIAQKYVPSTAKFVTSEEEQNKYEVMFYDDKNRESFEVEVDKSTREVKKIESQLIDDLGSETVKLTEKEVEAIIKKEFSDVTSVKVTLKKDNGLYEYEADFKGKASYGDADVHPVSGKILESTVKFGTTVTIPVEENNGSSNAANSQMLTYEQAEEAVVKEAGGGFVKDIDFEKKKGYYYYEVELIKDNVEYDYYVDAKTGKITLENQHESYFHYDDEEEDNYVKPQNPSSSNQSSSSNAGNNNGNSNNSVNNSSQSASNSGNTQKPSTNSDRISSEKAKSIVLAKIPGATILKLKLEREDGIYVYEGEARRDGYEYEFEINASSGIVLKWDAEAMDHDDQNWDDDDDDDDDHDWDD